MKDGPKAEKAGRKSQKPKEADMREAILMAASTIITTQGYSACTMRSISQQVNIKAGSLYYHFAGKNEIVVEIMNKGVEMMLQAVQEELSALPDEADFNSRLTTAVRAHIESKLDRESPYMRVYEHLTPVIKREGREMRRRYAAIWFEMFESAKAAGTLRRDLDLEMFIPFLLSALNRIPEWFNREQMRTADAAEMIVAQLTRGIFVEKGAAV